MNSHLIIQVTALLVAFLNVNAAITNNLTNIRTNFVQNATLSSNELDAVISLAKSCGIAEVAEVRTFNYRPTGDRGITVISTEKVEGRKITFQTLEIFFEEWSRKSKPSGAGTKSNGKFWVAGLGLPYINEITTFATTNGIIRVDVDPNIALTKADKMIKALTTAKIRYAKFPFVEEHRRTDFSQPIQLRKSLVGGALKENHYLISFSENLNQYEFILDGDNAKLVSVILVEI